MAVFGPFRVWAMPARVLRMWWPREEKRAPCPRTQRPSRRWLGDCGWPYYSFGPPGDVRSMVHGPSAVAFSWPSDGLKRGGRKREGRRHGSSGYCIGNSPLWLFEPILSWPQCVPQRPGPLGEREYCDWRHRARKPAGSFGAPLQSIPSRPLCTFTPGI